MDGSTLSTLLSEAELTQKRLTIAVPTWNRAGFLTRLLERLLAECANSIDEIEIIVSDNASTDDTNRVLTKFDRSAPFVRVIRNARNIGADANVSQCYEAAEGQYVWILGDDDLPMRGLVPAVLALLNGQNPDLIYIPSLWMPDITAHAERHCPANLASRALTRPKFVKTVSYWFTYLSGWVVKKAVLEGPLHTDYTKVAGTHFLQLAWLLARLRDGSIFLAFNQPAILATSENSGGYAALSTFGVDFPMIVGKYFDSKSYLARTLVGDMLVKFMPTLTWSVRFRRGAAFHEEKPWVALRRTFGGYAFFWFFFAPILLLPRPLAFLFLLAARAWAVFV